MSLMDSGFADQNVPCVDYFHKIFCLIIDIEVAAGRTHETVIVDILALDRLHPFAFRHCCHAVPFAVFRSQSMTRCLLENFLQKAYALPAFSVQCAAVRPPDHTVIIEECFTMAGITSAQGCFPESSDHLFAGDISPAVRQVAFIGDFIHDDRFVESRSEFVRQFTTFVKIDSLYGAVSDPWTAVIIHHAAVVNGARMLVQIFVYQNRSQCFPVLLTLRCQKVMFICQRPPDIAAGGVTVDKIFHIHGILFRCHAAESPSVIRMHDDQVCFDTAFAKFGNAVVQILEVCRIQTVIIEMIAFILSEIGHEVFFIQHGCVHRCAFIRENLRIIQIESIMLRENAETQFIEARFHQAVQCFFFSFFTSQMPHIRCRSDRIERCAILVAEMMCVSHSDRSVNVFIGRVGIERAGQCLIQKRTFDDKCVFAFKRRHKTQSVYTVSVIETINDRALVLACKDSFQRLLKKRISV